MTICLAIDRVVIEDDSFAFSDRAAFETALVEALRTGLVRRATAGHSEPVAQRLGRLIGEASALPPASSAAAVGEAIAAGVLATLDAAGTLPRIGSVALAAFGPSATAGAAANKMRSPAAGRGGTPTGLGKMGSVS
jgi:hypothetical protein